MSLPKAKNYIPINDYPLVHYKQTLAILSKTCAVTGERIPRFTWAWQQVSDYLIRDMIHTEIAWMSDKGYMLLKLRGDA